jgi:catechol 2,3-dioxygenase-like lactoylglutathione lyase family enzyme
LLSDCRVSAALPVSDLARARSFYVDTLGLTPLLEGEDVLAFRGADETDFGVFVSQGRPSGTHTQVTFFCQNIDAEVANLRARGVQREEFDMPGPRSRTTSMT